MSTGYQVIEQDKPYFITLQVVKWIDVFSRKKYRDILVESLAFCQKNKGLELFAWVIMSNHVHLIIRHGNGNLSSLIRDIKSYSSKAILKEIATSEESRRDWMLFLFSNTAAKNRRNSNFQFWTHENHAIFLYSDKFFKQKLEYIHNNPVRAGIVELPNEYIYSSAKAYAEGNGLLDVIVIHTKWKTY